jgi:hypothetical protein
VFCIKLCGEYRKKSGYVEVLYAYIENPAPFMPSLVPVSQYISKDVCFKFFLTNYFAIFVKKEIKIVN